jgi:hypothetical protein
MPLSEVLSSSIALGEIGAVSSHILWVRRLARAKVEAGLALSGAPKIRNTRIALLFSAAIVGVAFGFVVGFIGYLTKTDLPAIYALAFFAGFAPVAIVDKLAGNR